MTALAIQLATKIVFAASLSPLVKDLHFEVVNLSNVRSAGDRIQPVFDLCGDVSVGFV